MTARTRRAVQRAASPRLRPAVGLRLGHVSLAFAGILLAACAGPGNRSDAPGSGATDRSGAGPGGSPGAAAVASPAWYRTSASEPGMRLVQAEAEGGTREEALLNAQDRALEEASHQLATMVSSAIDRRIRETRDATLEKARVRVEELNRSDLAVRSSALLRGWKKVREDALLAGGTWRAWVRVAVPAEHYDMSRPEWFLARAQDAAQLGEATLESCWYQYGVAVFAEHAGLRQAYVDSLRRSGDLEEALQQAVELLRRDASEAHRAQVGQLAWQAFEVLDGSGKHRQARVALATLLSNDLAGGDESRIRDTLARSAREEAAETMRRGDLVRARSCLDEALAFRPAAALADEISKDREAVDRKLRDPFGSARRKLLALAAEAAQPELLWVRCDDPVLSLGGKRLHYSIWTAEPFWLWTLWVEAEAIYSADYLESVSGTKLGAGESGQIARLSVASTTEPGAIDYIVLAGRGDHPDFLTAGDFDKPAVNDPYREKRSEGQASKAERLQQLLTGLEAAVSHGDIFMAGFQFRVTR